MALRWLPLAIALLVASPGEAASLDFPRMIPLPGGEFIHPAMPGGFTLQVDPFELGETPVTWAQYKRFALGTPHWNADLATHEAEFPADAPVVYVTWDDADAFCRASGLRLPTEVEWEYAAAAGARKLPTTFTPEESAELRWYGGAKKTPHPVRQSPPNKLGLYDLHGNVWEWVAEVRGTFTRQDSRDPNEGLDNLGCGQVRTTDGSYAWFLRTAVRSSAAREQTMRFRGFRCAR